QGDFIEGIGRQLDAVGDHAGAVRLDLDADVVVHNALVTDEDLHRVWIPGSLWGPPWRAGGHSIGRALGARIPAVGRPSGQRCRVSPVGRGSRDATARTSLAARAAPRAPVRWIPVPRSPRRPGEARARQPRTARRRPKGSAVRKSCAWAPGRPAWR